MLSLVRHRHLVAVVLCIACVCEASIIADQCQQNFHLSEDILPFRRTPHPFDYLNFDLLVTRSEAKIDEVTASAVLSYQHALRWVQQWIGPTKMCDIVAPSGSGSGNRIRDFTFITLMLDKVELQTLRKVLNEQVGNYPATIHRVVTNCVGKDAYMAVGFIGYKYEPDFIHTDDPATYWSEHDGEVVSAVNMMKDTYQIATAHTIGFILNFATHQLELYEPNNVEHPLFRPPRQVVTDFLLRQLQLETDTPWTLNTEFLRFMNADTLKAVNEHSHIIEPSSQRFVKHQGVYQWKTEWRQLQIEQACTGWAVYLCHQRVLEVPIDVLFKAIPYLDTRTILAYQRLTIERHRAQYILFPPHELVFCAVRRAFEVADMEGIIEGVKKEAKEEANEQASNDDQDEENEDETAVAEAKKPKSRKRRVILKRHTSVSPAVKPVRGRSESPARLKKVRAENMSPSGGIRKPIRVTTGGEEVSPVMKKAVDQAINRSKSHK